MSTYNYSTYAAAYGQQYPQQSAYTTQQTSTAGYGQYGQSAYGVSTTATSTTASASNTYGYGSAVTTTSSSNFGYGGQTGYNYGYSTDASSAYNTTNAQNSALQAFQQSWYNSTPSAAASSGTSTQQTGAAAPAAATTGQQATQQQAYGNYGQYNMQQYQQMTAYQQYANANTAKTTPQQQSGWGTYSQNQQNQNTATNRTDTTNKQTGGWGGYQQSGTTQTANTGSQQHKTSTGVVYRSPMKYPQNDSQSHGYGASNMSQGYNANQGYKGSNTTTGQAYNSSTTQGYGMNQGYSSTNQSYNMGNQQFKTPQSGGYSTGGFGNTSGYGNNQSNFSSSYNQSGSNYSQGYGQQNYNKGYNAGSNRNDNQQTGRSPSSTGQKTPQRGQVEAPFQPYQQQGAGMGQGRAGSMNNMASRGRGGIRPLMGRGSPLGGNIGYAGPARPGPQDGPDIPPFPQAWQDYEGTGQGEWQRGQGGFNEGQNRWNRGGGMGRGRHSQQSQQQQPKGIYNNNSRNARGTTSSNRELWSPAGGKKTTGGSNITLVDSKPVPPKKEENETADKDKQTEIKSFLYAWLGSRHTRPIYDIRQVGERPNISFRCDLRVDKFHFVGVGEAQSKKEAQTAAAWDFADFLIKNGELNEADLPPRHSKLMDVEGDFGTIKDEEEETPGKMEEKPREYKRADGIRRRDQRYGNQHNWGGRGRQNMGRGRVQTDIQPQPLMAQPVGPWQGPGGMGMGMPPHPHPHPHPHALLPTPGMMDYGNQWDEGWGYHPMGPPPMPMRGPIRPMGPMPPPFMRRNQNEYWRRRDMEERMYEMKWNQGDWQNPEDIFIHQMIRNQQESERRRGPMGSMPPLEAMPGEWQSVAQSRPVVTSDDRHVMAKHAEIYPQEGELKTVHRIVNTVEQALKLLSDKFVDEDHPRAEAKEEKEKEEEKDKKETKDEGEEKKEGGEDKQMETETKEGEKEESDNQENKEEEKKDETKNEEKRAKIKILKRPKKAPKQVDTRPRVLCGVNRIGPLAKGLLISKDNRVDLALLCGEVPTITLLDRIMEHMLEKLNEVDKDFNLSVERREEEAGFLVISNDEKAPVQLMVTLTATSLRKGGKKEGEEKAEEKEEENGEEGETKEEKEKEETSTEEKEETKAEESDPVGMLPKQYMLDALACLRHTHWFQAKACGLQSCVILTRIIRDLQRRDDGWKVIPEWALEVLLYNCLVSSDEQMSPGDAFRRILEVIAGGILLPGLPGIQDPCEKQTRDILDCMSVQQKEDITRSAQSYLRRLAFREIHKILGMEKLPPTFKMAHENRPSNPLHDRPFNRSSELKEKEKEKDETKQVEPNNLRKRRFEPNGNDSVAESPKRSLTDEEDTDTQQNLAELSISDEASEGRSLDEGEGEKKPEKKDETATVDEADLLSKADDLMDTEEQNSMSQEEEDALLEDKMDP